MLECDRWGGGINGGDVIGGRACYIIWRGGVSICVWVA